MNGSKPNGPDHWHNHRSSKSTNSHFPSKHYALYYTNFQFEFVHLILCYQLDVIQCPALELIIILSGYFYDSLLSWFRCGSKNKFLHYSNSDKTNSLTYRNITHNSGHVVA